MTAQYMNINTLKVIYYTCFIIINTNKTKQSPPGQADGSMSRDTFAKCDELSLNPRIHMKRENRLLQSSDVFKCMCVYKHRNVREYF